MSALASSLWWWDQLITLEGPEGPGGVGGVPEVPLYSNMKSGARQHLVHHGIQEGTLTPSLECDAVAWNV